MSLRRPLFALVLLAALGGRAHAARTEFLVKKDGVRLPGAEICFFRGTSVASPFTAFFRSNDVTCLDADQIVDIPKGQWNFFARHRDGYTSVYTGLVTFSHDYPDDAYKAVSVPVVRSAVVDLSTIAASLEAPAYAGVLIVQKLSQSGRNRFVPLIPGEKTVQVPDGQPFFVVVVRDRQVAAIGYPVEAHAGATVHAELPHHTDRGDVIAWINVQRTPDPRAGLDADPPVVTLIAADGRRFLPVIAHHPEPTDLQIFKDVPAGHARVVVSAPNWETDEAPVTVEAGRVATTATLTTALAARLTLHVPRPEPARGATAVALLRCADPARTPPADCSVASEQWSQTGVAIFDSVVRGDYVARIQDDCFVRLFAMPGTCDEIDASCPPVRPR